MTLKRKRCILVFMFLEWERSLGKRGRSIKHEGVYYMTYSANSYESQFYGIGCATATDIMGEWTKYDDNPCLKPGNLVGVGHSSLFRDKEGDLRIVFHAHHDENNIHPRKMYIGRLGFKPDGEVDKLYIEEEYEIPVLKK